MFRRSHHAAATRDGWNVEDVSSESEGQRGTGQMGLAALIEAIVHPPEGDNVVPIAGHKEAAQRAEASAA